VIRLDDLPLDLSIHETGTRGGDAGPGVLTLKEARDRFEHAYVLRALERENWNQSRAARRLGVHRNTLLARLAGWGIRRDEDPAGARGSAAAP
jgi:DNA-binding NtrC family response regulator